MNLSLIDPFLLTQDYPETATHVLRSGHTSFVRFNRKGDLLAAGRVDGTIVIFDVETYGVARKLKGHRRQIYSLSWSRDGRYILSASQDCKCIIWDLQDGSILRDVRMGAPCYVAELHPWNPFMFVAAILEKSPKLVDCTDPEPVKMNLPISQKRAQDSVDMDVDAKALPKHAVTTIVFTATGDHLIAGTAKGFLLVMDLRSHSLIYSSKIASGFITHIRLANTGRDVLVNAGDRVIRTIQLPNLMRDDLDPDTLNLAIEHKFADVVNRLSWNHVAFSATGEYVMASTYNHHDIYIWERVHGSLVKILDGRKEEHGTVEWHPHRPLITACGLETGRIHIWSIVPQQRWSALAPDFVEVVQNDEYVEREDEFDIYPQEELHKRRLDAEDEDVDVLGDVHANTVDAGRPRDDDAFTMPVSLDAVDSESEENEFVSVGRGELRRKSPTAGREFLADDGLPPGSADEARRTKARKR